MPGAANAGQGKEHKDNQSTKTWHHCANILYHIGAVVSNTKGVCTMAKRAAQGAGTIRKKTVTRKGKEYTYWEARLTIGRDPGTGKQIQQSFSGKTQKEVREKMQAAAVEVNTGTYIPPAKMTVGQWLDIWSAEYLGNLKPSTVTAYTGKIRNYIKPAMGAVKLSELRPHAVQAFINGLEGLSPATVTLIYKVLHAAMKRAVRLEYIAKNPADDCILPKAEKADIKPLDDAQTALLLSAAKGTDIEHLITVALFTGMRQSELLGLTWDSIDMEKGTILVDKQLALAPNRAKSIFATPKNGKSRTISPAVSVLHTLKAQRVKQKEMQLKAGPLWNNAHNLVFTLADGGILEQWRVQSDFNHILNDAELGSIRFHDLRHTYAVNAIRAGDDIKSVQGNLGHASAAFTLDRYGHFTEQMKQDSASRMEQFMKGVLNL